MQAEFIKPYHSPLRTHGVALHIIPFVGQFHFILIKILFQVEHPQPCGDHARVFALKCLDATKATPFKFEYCRSLSVAVHLLSSVNEL